MQEKSDDDIVIKTIKLVRGWLNCCLGPRDLDGQHQEKGVERYMERSKIERVLAPALRLKGIYALMLCLPNQLSSKCPCAHNN